MVYSNCHFSSAFCLTFYSLYVGKPGGHPRSLTSAFVVRCLDSIIPLVSISKISSLYLASVVAQAGLRLTCSKNPKTGFLLTRPGAGCGIRLYQFLITALLSTLKLFFVLSVVHSLGVFCNKQVSSIVKLKAFVSEVHGHRMSSCKSAILSVMPTRHLSERVLFSRSGYLNWQRCDPKKISLCYS